MLTIGAAHAAPDFPSDALSRFLARNNASPTTGGQPGDDQATNQPGLVQKIRNRASEMVVTSMNFLGVPYARGGTSAESGFDCSGFTRYIFEHSLGLVLPRRADEQATAAGLVKVKRDELKPGDLVFFNTLKRTFSHVGIYVGEGKFIHAPRTGGEVRVEDMGLTYWAKRFTGARRVSQSAQQSGQSGQSAAQQSNQPSASPQYDPAISAMQAAQHLLSAPGVSVGGNAAPGLVGSGPSLGFPAAAVSGSTSATPLAGGMYEAAP